jgi:hypothetical protein
MNDQLDVVRALLADASNAVSYLMVESDSPDKDRLLAYLDKAIDEALNAVDACTADHDQIAYDRHVDQQIDEARRK